MNSSAHLLFRRLGLASARALTRIRMRRVTQLGEAAIDA